MIMQNARGINLLHLRERQHDLPSVTRTFQLLTRVAFEIDRLKRCQVLELRFECIQIGDLVIVQLEEKERRPARRALLLSKTHVPRAPLMMSNVRCFLSQE